MLTYEEKIALKNSILSNIEKLKYVSPEEVKTYPAQVETIKVPTCHGDCTVYVDSPVTPHKNCPTIINFHGGGFIGPHMDRDQLYCRKLTAKHNAVVFDVDYKLSPEYPFPTAVEESWDVAQWVYKNAAKFNGDPNKLILAGHSSGGNLVATICMKNGEAKAIKILCALIDYAPMDLFTDPDKKTRSICDMPAERAKMYNEKYVKPELAKDPYASPLFAPDSMLENFPDTLFVTAGEDSLCWEDEEFALKLARAGACVTLKRFTNSVHGFNVNRCCEWESCLDLQNKYIADHLK